jgi:hypothetical protein
MRKMLLAGTVALSLSAQAHAAIFWFGVNGNVRQTHAVQKTLHTVAPACYERGLVDGREAEETGGTHPK